MHLTYLGWLKPASLGLFLALVVSMNTQVEAQIQVPKDPYSLVLIRADLEDADKTLSMRDLDDDGALSEAEWAKLEWASKASQADLNRDKKLTQPEIALYFASQRKESDVEQIDRTVAERSMRKHDLNRNGQIDPNEITPAWPEEPQEIDVNSDGILTLSELTNAFAFRRVVRREIGIIGVDQGWAIKIRNRFDRDRDGGLNPDEWDGTPLPSSPEDFDEDGDKQLTLMEIATMLAKHRQKLGLTANDQLSARALIQGLDRNFDGTISKEELQPFEEQHPQVPEQLKAYDTNGDGNTTLMEIEKVLSERRDKLGYSDRDAAEAKRLILRHDQNRDKVIRKSELKKESGSGLLGEEVLPQADRNGDQAIDQDELARYLARQRS